MFPKKGKVFPGRGNGSGTRAKYAEIVAKALRAQLGDTHQAIKTAMKWTGGSERTVKHWLRGDAGPHGDYLLCLLRESPELLNAILVATGWSYPGRSIAGVGPTGAESGGDLLAHALGRYRALHHDEIAGYASSSGNDPDHDPKNDPDRVPDNDPDRANKALSHLLSARSDLNERQLWFVSELALGHRASQRDLCDRFNVAEKTAKRDIADLKRKSLVSFVGSRRAGMYRLGVQPAASTKTTGRN